MTIIPRKALKATYNVRQWPYNIVMLAGTAREVFEALGLSGAGSNQAKFLALATPDTTTVFVNGTCICFINDPIA